jgi:peptide/nickel transport system substrate-binding protein
MRKQTISVSLVLAIVSVLVLAACQPGAAPPEDEEVPADAAEEETEETEELSFEGDIVLHAPVSKDIRLDPATVDPTDEDSLLVSGYIYEGLFAFDTEAEGQLAEALGTGVTVSDDGLDYIIDLRRDVVFHDGTPLDADAVIANFNRWFDPEDSAHGSGTYAEWELIFEGFKGETNDDGTPKSTFDGIEKVDNYTVLLHLSRVDPGVVGYISIFLPAFGMASPALLTEGDSYGTSAESTAGTGPYKVGEWSDEKLVLVPNPDYWGDVPTAALEFPLE